MKKLTVTQKHLLDQHQYIETIKAQNHVSYYANYRYYEDFIKRNKTEINIALAKAKAIDMEHFEHEVKDENNVLYFYAPDGTYKMKEGKTMQQWEAKRKGMTDEVTVYF